MSGRVHMVAVVTEVETIVLMRNGEVNEAGGERLGEMLAHAGATDADMAAYSLGGMNALRGLLEARGIGTLVLFDRRGNEVAP